MKLINQLLSTTYVNIMPDWKSKPMPLSKTQNSLMGGLLAHLGPVLIFCLLTELYDFDPAKTLLIFIFVFILAVVPILLTEWITPAVTLSIPKRQDILYGFGFVVLTGVGVGSVIVALTWYVCDFFLPKCPMPVWISIWLSVVLADFVYYFTHRFLNHGPKTNTLCRWFRQNHAPHHAVKALDFLRGNNSSLMDTAVTSFQVPAAITGALFGLSLTQVMVAYALLMMLQSTHHVNFTFNIGWLRYVFVDNHNHKLHHCPRGYLVNYGAVFSLWDRLFGTFYENWDLSSSDMIKNHIALPIQPGKNR